jgi:ribosome-associated protein
MIKFKLKTEYLELHSLLKANNLCGSGGEAKEVISASLVKVDGRTETRRGCKIRPGQVVEYNGEKIVVE